MLGRRKRPPGMSSMPGKAGSIRLGWALIPGKRGATPRISIARWRAGHRGLSNRTSGEVSKQGGQRGHLVPEDV